MTQATLAMQVVASVGLLLAIEGVFEIVAGSTVRSFPMYLPSGMIENSIPTFHTARSSWLR